ncbi:unnamed protein product [Cyclocybe aegerita]|uniref:DJ-1/PfpI domain-containing protein n=1 Tax=Cyclocybe aegerita TaxID=1973307 RepID=A0A8S0WSR8_CYCAE|nr:unnamed protein product [Cyclocybe aegerita]
MKLYSALPVGLLFVVQGRGQDINDTSSDPLPLPQNYGVVLFPAFQALDVFGPLDILNLLSISQPLNLAVLAPTLDPVSTKPRMTTHANSNFSQSIIPTHTFDNPPSDLEVLIVPGGIGTRAPSPELDAHVAFIKETYPKLRYLVGVCTGVGLMSRTGILDGKKATGNKRSWAWVTAQSNKVHWIAHARWIRSGNIWTTSGVAAGIDGMFDFVKTVYGEEVALNLANGLEYERELDWQNDPFATLYNLTDVLPVP